MTTASQRVLGYIGLALLCYGIAVGLGGVSSAALGFVAAGTFFEGVLWMQARRRRRRNARRRD